MLFRIHGAHLNKSLDTGSDMRRLESLVSMLDTIFANGTTVDGKFLLSGKGMIAFRFSKILRCLR